MNRRYQRTATTITSGGNRNPANADLGGSHGRGRLDNFTAQACLDLANAQRNSALAADRVGLPTIGRIRPGCAADLVVFDLDEIADTTTYFDTTSSPRGIQHVLVNDGTAIVDEGAYRPARAGRVYRRG